jgi:hypothetical protein
MQIDTLLINEQIIVKEVNLLDSEEKSLDSNPSIPPQYAYPQTVLQRTNCLGSYLQVVTNFKVWFDSSTVSLLIQGSPDLYGYGLQGGSGLMTRSHASDKKTQENPGRKV